MGYAKDKWIDEQAGGWHSVPGKYICADCVDDDDLKQLVRNQAEGDSCSYCGKTGADTSVLLDRLIERVVSATNVFYEDYGKAGFPWPEDEYGMQNHVLDAYDVLERLELDIVEEARQDIQDSLMERQWTDVHAYFPTLSQELSRSWRAFESLVKRSRRYTFLVEDSVSPGDNAPGPARLLRSILAHADDLGLIRTLGPSTDLLRARVHDAAKKISTCKAIGTPSARQARNPNRMSPAGIPMFYGASDRETAFAEVYDCDRNTVDQILTIGRFRPSQPLRVLDLTTLPAMPGVFSERNHLIYPLTFLKEFSRSVSRRVKRDGREHVEYVPTQIVTEYIRFRHRQTEDLPIDGLIFYSSSSRGGKCYVLFFAQQQCVRPMAVMGEPVLVLQELVSCPVRKLVKKIR